MNITQQKKTRSVKHKHRWFEKFLFLSSDSPLLKIVNTFQDVKLQKWEQIWISEKSVLNLGHLAMDNCTFQV